MKKLLIAIIAIASLASCNNKKDDSKTAGDNKEKTNTPDNITYPYSAEYSHDFSMGDPSHAKMVLDFMKLYEADMMSDMRPMLADTVAIDFPDGNKFRGTADSVIKFGSEFRKQYSDIKIKLDAWMPVHSNDKNEDWVLIWSKEYVTKNGVVDSSYNHSYWQIKNNKIAFWSEFLAKLSPAPGQ